MTIHRWTLGTGPRRQPAPGSPIADIVIGAEPDRLLGLVEVTIPANSIMDEHAHGASEALLIPQAGHLRLINVDDETVIELEPGVLATITVGQRVKLENPDDTDSRMFVALSPPDFANALASWPVID